jgi:hypothetical protein
MGYQADGSATESDRSRVLEARSKRIAIAITRVIAIAMQSARDLENLYRCGR